MASYVGDFGIFFTIVLVVVYVMWDELFPN